MRLSAAVALAGLACMATIQAASDVIDLNTKNFAATVNPEKLMLVEFFAPWCGHCKALAPEYEIAATQLKDINVPLAKVDCTVETDLCQEHGVQGYPTLKVFRDGQPVDYNGPRKADGIVSYMKKQSLPALSEVTSENLATFSESDTVVIVGVLPKDSEKRATLETVANLYRDDFVFGVVEESPDVKATGVVLFKKFDEGKNVLEGDFDEVSLVEFIKTNSVPVMDEIGPNNYARYMDSGLPLAYYFFSSDDERSEHSTELEALAKGLKGKMNFVYIDANKFGAHASNLNLKEVWPAFGVQDVTSGAKYPLDQDLDFSIEGVKALVNGVIDGSAKPSIKSEPIPEKNDDPVKVVVAHSYKDIVEDLSKDVLIEFYAPWCGHCKKLVPIYDRIGELYEGSNIVVAKMDATANDLPTDAPFQIQGFPTIKFRKAGSTEYIDYNGDRTIADFIEFLGENATEKFEVDLNKESKHSHGHGHDHGHEHAEDDHAPTASSDDVEHDEL